MLFHNSIKGKYSKIKEYHRGVFIIYTLDTRTKWSRVFGTFVDGTLIMAMHEDPITASLNLQDHLLELKDLFIMERN